MNEWTTVFEISWGSNGVLADTLFRTAIGVGGLIFGIRGLVRTKRHGTLRKDLLGSLLSIGFGILWLTMHIPLLGIAFRDIPDLVEACHSGKCGIVEGRVHVIRQQPYHGHSSGDRIRIGDQEFEVNYFLATPGYCQTISHGGALSEGVLARIHHAHGVILKVEVAKK